MRRAFRSRPGLSRPAGHAMPIWASLRVPGNVSADSRHTSIRRLAANQAMAHAAAAMVASCTTVAPLPAVHDRTRRA